MTLTAKQERFADTYEGNAREAAEAAGITHQYGRRLVMDATKSNIESTAIAVQERIEARNKDNPAILTRKRRQELWSKWTEGKEKPTPEQLKASELLGKSELDFGDRVRHEVEPQSIADIAAIMGARRPEPPIEPLKVLEAPIEPVEQVNTGDKD